MCDVKNVPVFVKSCIPGDELPGRPGMVGIDGCMVDLVKLIEFEPDCATVYCCCGHGRGVPYLLCCVPPSKIPWVLSRLAVMTDWPFIALKVERCADAYPGCARVYGLDVAFLPGKVWAWFGPLDSAELRHMSICTHSKSHAKV